MYASKRSHMANVSVWVGASGTGMDFSLDADVFLRLLAMVNMIYSIHLSHLNSTMYSTILKRCEK